MPPPAHHHAGTGWGWMMWIRGGGGSSPLPSLGEDAGAARCCVNSRLGGETKAAEIPPGSPAAYFEGLSLTAQSSSSPVKSL